MNGFLIDPHVHSAETSPCGRMPAEQLVELYARANFDGIIITDHYTRDFFSTRQIHAALDWQAQLETFLAGYRRVRGAAQGIDLAVFLGLELRFDGLPNDYLVYGLDEDFLLAHPALYTQTLKSFRRLTRNLEILIIQAHPFRSGNRPAMVQLLDGMEIYNGNLSHDSRNRQALCFARKNNLLALAGSDSHKPEDVGRGGMRFPNRLGNIREFIAGIAEAEPWVTGCALL